MTEINAELFNKAADELERRGLNKGWLADEDEYEEDPENCKVCMWGAINIAVHGDPDFTEIDEQLNAALKPYFADTMPQPFSRPGVAFNDYYATTKEDVVAKLREIAASLA